MREKDYYEIRHDNIIEYRTTNANESDKPLIYVDTQDKVLFFTTRLGELNSRQQSLMCNIAVVYLVRNYVLIEENKLTERLKNYIKGEK